MSSVSDDEIHILTAREFGALMGRLQAIETSHRAQTGRIRQLEDENSEREDQLVTIKHQTSTLQSELVRLRTDKASHVGEMDRLTKALATAKSDCAALTERYTQIWGADRELDRVFVAMGNDQPKLCGHVLRYMQSASGCSTDFRQRVAERVLVYAAFGEWYALAADAQGGPSEPIVRRGVNHARTPSDAEVFELLSVVLVAGRCCARLPSQIEQRIQKMPRVAYLARAVTTGSWPVFLLSSTDEEQHLAAIVGMFDLAQEVVQHGSVKDPNAGCCTNLGRICKSTRYDGDVAAWVKSASDPDS